MLVGYKHLKDGAEMLALTSLILAQVQHSCCFFYCPCRISELL
jgi:hypothetical protein